MTSILGISAFYHDSAASLIIDDDIWMQRIMLKNLKQYGFEEIHTVSNGFEGIALAVEHQPTLIVLDIIMKELDGLVTLKILKTIKRKLKK